MSAADAPRERDYSVFDSELSGQAFDFRHLRRLLRWLRPHRARAIQSAGFVVVASVLAVLGPVVLSRVVIDGILVPERDSLTAPTFGMQEAAAWIGREPIEITQLPFVVGRLGDGEDESSDDHVDLILDDEKPYQLSRQHFVIDTCDGELVVRDSGSYHGTTVNSQRIGDDRETSMVPLHLGENSIIAGSTESPYCFTLLIEAS